MTSFYHTVDSCGDLIAVFNNRDEALDAYESSLVGNVFNTYRPGYHRELTKVVFDGVTGIFRRPTRAECVANDAVGI